MSRLLRLTRLARWFRYPTIDRLLDDEIQGDALRDLQTQDNNLSVYKAESDEDTDRIVTALAVNRDNLANVDYALFDDVALLAADIPISKEPGKTPDDGVNKLHYNLSNLTVNRLATLAEVVSAGEHTRIPKAIMRTRLCRALDLGVLDRDKLKPWLLEMGD